MEIENNIYNKYNIFYGDDELANAKQTNYNFQIDSHEDEDSNSFNMNHVYHKFDFSIFNKP